MSYDIHFLSRDEGQSWDDVLDAADGAAQDSEPIPAELLEAWQRIVPQASALLGDVNITEYKQESRDLSHSDTGIDLSVFGDEVSITVPYWHNGDGAARVLAKLFTLCAVVEKETGLTTPSRTATTARAQPWSQPDACQILLGTTEKMPAADQLGHHSASDHQGNEGSSTRASQAQGSYAH
ncbi:hypothetical protein [Streptomyces sp. NPDC056938]|uniref:hypothetical protein n=1 Tax=Streptomyces sp. NPDC056938 TaxID=3345970 RepID=UPI00362A5308